MYIIDIMYLFNIFIYKNKVTFMSYLIKRTSSVVVGATNVTPPCAAIGPQRVSLTLTHYSDVWAVQTGFAGHQCRAKSL